MIDGSHHDYEDNVALTRKVVEYAHAHGVTVEGELGRLAGIEDDVNVSDEDASYTNPAQVQDFVERTGVDSLAIAIGTSHGAYKFKPGQKPQLRFDILQEVSERLPGFPIVLHGASSVVPEFVEMINANGGNMREQLVFRKICSVKLLKWQFVKLTLIPFTFGNDRHSSEIFSEHPEHFDPRQYLVLHRTAIKEIVTHKKQKKNVLGCDGQHKLYKKQGI